MTNLITLNGKTALITGGTSGLGRATAEVLLQRGARVVIVDVNPETPRLAQELSPTAALGVVADVRDRDSLDEAVAAAVARFERVDISIANAGVLSRGATLRSMPSASVDQLFAVNIGGVVNTVSATVEQIIENRGHIVLISSVFAFLNGMGTIPYAMSKAAVEQLGRGLRVELAQHGASVTTAYFSLIETDMIRNGVDADPTVTRLMGALPRPLLVRIQPHQAATAIVDGIERRAPRVMKPGRWAPLSALRGVLSPALDARLAGDRQTQSLLGELETRTS
jgi:NAD(P)-dependent dehydrogenase (short-subunit alcohol dehydrogenase family)